MSVTTCPLDLIAAGTWELIGLADLFKRGLPPVAGGVLDQAAGFVEAARFIWSEQDRHKAELQEAAWNDG